MRSSERGGAIIMMFILLALFAMVSFAFLRGSGSNMTWIKSEQTKATATGTQDCTNTVMMALKRLELRGCGSLVSYNADGSNANSGAPTDGSCSIFHPNGGGAKVCGNYAPCIAAQFSALTIGQSCSGITYVGNDYGGTRNYTVATTHGTSAFTSLAYPSIDTGANSDLDGWGNTTKLLTQPPGSFPPASTCRALGSKWYMPAWGELETLYFNRNVPALSGFIDTSAKYWSSTQFGWDSFTQDMASGSHPTHGSSDIYKYKCFYKP